MYSASKGNETLRAKGEGKKEKMVINRYRADGGECSDRELEEIDLANNVGAVVHLLFEGGKKQMPRSPLPTRRARLPKNREKLTGNRD